MATVTIPQPDDWHVHLRDDDMLKAVAPITAAHYGRAVAMPNLKDPITSRIRAQEYKKRILEAVSHGSSAQKTFTPLVPSYLTDHTDVDDLINGIREGDYWGAKLYPANATTLSHQGVSDFSAFHKVLSALDEEGATLMVHAETSDDATSILHREKAFIDEYLQPWSKRYSKVRIVMEHISTAAGIEFVKGAREGVGGTITPHHALLSIDAIFLPSLQPLHFCLPILKTPKDRKAIVDAITSGNPKFMAGTDSAPHTLMSKFWQGSAGIFNTPNALAIYTHIFAQCNALDKLRTFVSDNGIRFHDVAPPKNSLTLSDEQPPSSHDTQEHSSDDTQQHTMPLQDYLDIKEGKQKSLSPMHINASHMNGLVWTLKNPSSWRVVE